MNMVNKPSHRKLLVSVKTLGILNVICLVSALALSVLVDLNGHITGLSDKASLVVTVVVFVVAYTTALNLAIRGRGAQRVMGIVSMLVYLAIIAPAIWPW